MAKRKVKHEETEEVNLLWEEIKVIAVNSAKCLHPKELKAMWKSGFEKRMYLASILANPMLFRYATHNKYFICDFGIEYYAAVTFLGYFVEKGIVKTFIANHNITLKKSKKTSLVNRHVVNKHEKQLCDVLTSLNIPHTVAKTNTTEFSTRIYILSDAPIKTILNSEREIAKRMSLENKNLTITIDKSYFVFDIRSSEQKVYYFDEYLKKVKEQQLKEKELPFLLGIHQSTGKMIVEDLNSGDSFLVAGARGNGKSCFVNVLIQSLMTFALDKIIFFLIDFKGNELSQYKNFLNCTFFGARSHSRVNKILDELITEMESRNMKMGKLKNIKDYNEIHEEKLPYIVIIIDELSLVTIRGGKLSDDINEKLTELLNVGRAAGIIVIGAMQRPNAEQIDTNVRAMLDSKFVFRVAKKSETQFTDTEGAEKLAKGEFIANTKTFDCERFKGLFIDDKKRNFVFEKLENKFANGGVKDDFILNLDK